MHRQASAKRLSELARYKPHSHKLFTFNSKSDQVSVVDARTLEVVATISASGEPKFAVSDAAGKIYFNIEDRGGIEVIDVPSNAIIEHWKLNGCKEPSGLAMNAMRQRLFATCQNRIMASPTPGPAPHDERRDR